MSILMNKSQYYKDVTSFVDSQDVIDRFYNDGKCLKYDWSYKELLNFYFECDIPSKSYYFKEFYDLLCDSFPKYNGESLKLYRGTNLESVNRHGYIGHIWTQDKKIAELFANLSVSNRYKWLGCESGNNPIILEGFFNSKYIAYKHINNRSENEVFLKSNYDDITFGEIDLQVHYL